MTKPRHVNLLNVRNLFRIGKVSDGAMNDIASKAKAKSHQASRQTSRPS